MPDEEPAVNHPLERLRHDVNDIFRVAGLSFLQFMESPPFDPPAQWVAGPKNRFLEPRKA